MLPATPASFDQAPARSWLRNRRVIAGSQIAVAAIFLYLLIYHYHHQTRGAGGHLGDFPTFYRAAQFAADHRDIYRSGATRAMSYVYPPLIAFVFRPLTLLTMARAAQVFLLLNTLMLLGAVLLSSRALLRRFGVDRLDSIWPAALLVSILSLNQMRAVLTMGETDGIMLFMFALALFWLDALPIGAGCALAIALNIKYLPIVVVPWLLIRRRWSVLLAMAVWTVAVALAPAAELGWRENLRCLRVSLGGLLLWVGVTPEKSQAIHIHDIADGLSVSITSGLARMLQPLRATNNLVLLCAAAIALAMLGIVYHMYRRRGFPMWKWPDRAEQLRIPFRGLMGVEWGVIVAAALIFSPDTNTRHLVMAMLVNAIAAAVLVSPSPRSSRLWALCGAVVIFLALLMPLGRELPALGAFYYRYSIPGWGLAIGSLLVMKAALNYIAAESHINAPST